MRLTADELHGKIGPAMPALTLLGSPERGRWLLVRGARRGGVEGHLVESGDESRVRLGRRALRGALARHGNLEIAAGERVRMRAGVAVDRELAAQQAVDAAQAGLNAAILNLERTQKLAAEGLASTRSLELAELSEQTSRADLLRARAAQAAARGEVKAMRADTSRIGSDTGAAVDAAKVALETARGDLARAEQELARIEVRQVRQGAMVVTASRDGSILRLIARQGGEMVKAGDPIAQFVPDTEARAVELWLDGIDAPLVTPGRHVRLQFEGWPAVQFVGWPSVAVGTFGGVVAYTDATDDGKGHFRVVVLPDLDAPPADQWPAAQYLRQGVRLAATRGEVRGASGSERTYVEIHTVGELLSGAGADWSTLGMILACLIQA